jgi:type II secretory pathway pseudopilin PulG
MKGQVSTELLVIVALVLLIFIPLLVLVYLKTAEANQQIASYQAELTVTRLASLANSVGSLGTNTSVVTDVYIPANTEYLATNQSGRGGEIVLKINTPQGTQEPSDILKYPVSNPGIVVEATGTGGWVKIRITSVYEGNEAHVKIEKVA